MNSFYEKAAKKNEKKIRLYCIAYEWYRIVLYTNSVV